MRFRKEPYCLKEPIELSFEEERNFGRRLMYSDEKICYPTFQLNITAGHLPIETQLVVILGKNGTGKTTYLDYLKQQWEGLVSNKPQLSENLELKDDGRLTVQDILHQHIREAMTSSSFSSDVLQLLGIPQLYSKKWKKLSGGEKQRVSLTLCLGRPAEVYLIDEPSANLDIEYRFNATKVIKRFLCHNRKVGFIVEHDILMAISLAKEINSKILVFDELSEGVCQTSGFLDFKTGINKFLASIQTTFRTDQTTGRPKINKLNSVLDQQQKARQTYYQ